MRKVGRVVSSILLLTACLTAITYGHGRSQWNLDLPGRQILVDMLALFGLSTFLVLCIGVMNKKED